MGSPEEDDESIGLTDVPQVGYENEKSTAVLVTVDEKAQWKTKFGDEVEISEDRGRFSRWLERNRILDKGIFVLSIATISALTHGLLTAHWLIPYYYAVAAPVLIGIRYIMYWKLKYQYFLIDFCYFGNLFSYIYIWAVPHSSKMFMVLFGITNGPLLWAIVFFRNSLVFHSADKMTSLFIHMLPSFVTYNIRWYPDTTATYWYSSFTQDFEMELPYLCIWLIAVPFAIYVLHSILYMLVVYGILKPSEEYLNSFRYLRDQENVFGRLIHLCGPRFTWLMYNFFYWTYCVLMVSFTILWFKCYLAHSIFILAMCILATWNGASYYIDVFAVKGFKAEG